MRSVVFVMAVFVGALILVGGEYLEPYDTAAGQVVLAVVAVMWAAGVAAMIRLGRPRRSTAT